MPKPYRKPHITMNRKKYGTKVRPVKQLKQESKLEKPSTAELRSIYSRLKKSASWQFPDILAEAVQWYRRMMTFMYTNMNNHNPRALDNFLAKYASLAKLGLQREKELSKAKHASGKEKVDWLVAALRLYEIEAEKLKLKVPAVTPYVKKAKTSAKKLDARKAKVEQRFDPLLTMLTAATNLDVELGAVPAIEGDIEFRYDSTLDKMLYSRNALAHMKKRIRSEGLLPVALEQVMYIAKAAAMKKNAIETGRYLVDDQQWVTQTAIGLRNLCKWLSTSQDAPNKLIKRTVPKKKRSVKRRCKMINNNTGMRCNLGYGHASNHEFDLPDEMIRSDYSDDHDPFDEGDGSIDNAAFTK